MPATPSISPYRPPAARVTDDAAFADEATYGGFWLRAGALVIDSIVTFALAWAAGLVIGFGLALAGVREGAIGLLGGLVGIAAAFFYFSLMESSERGATLGKRAFRLRVVSAAELDRISFGRAAGRYFARFISMLVLYIGYLMQPFTRRKQALHDIIAGTVVVLVAPVSGLLSALAVILALLVPVGGILAGIGIAAYQDYAVRARVAQSLAAVAPARVAVQAYWAQEGRFPGSLEEAGFKGDASGRLVQDASIDPASGAITVTFAFAPLEGQTLLLVPEKDARGGLTWACRPGTAKKSYLPASCR